MATYLVIGVLMKALAISMGRLERQSWQQIVVADLLKVAEVVGVVPAGSFLLGSTFAAWDTGFPRTVPILEGIIGILLLGSVRVFKRGRWSPRQVAATMIGVQVVASALGVLAWHVREPRAIALVTAASGLVTLGLLMRLWPMPYPLSEGT